RRPGRPSWEPGRAPRTRAAPPRRVLRSRVPSHRRYRPFAPTPRPRRRERGRREGYPRAMARPRFRYSPWDGTQRGFELDALDVMEQLTDDLLYHGDLNSALRRMMQQGFE